MERRQISFIKFLDALRRRTIFLFVLAGLFSYFGVDYAKMELKMLNRVVPPTDAPLVAFSLNPYQSPLNWRQYDAYYSTLTEVLPKAGAAFGMLGYCQYYEGKADKAIANYQRAIALSPDFFWFYYDLGTIYFQRGQYANAADIFEKALGCRPENALVFIHTSKIYRELERQASDAGYSADQGLSAGYHQVQEMVLIARYHLQSSVKLSYQPRIF